MQGDDGLTDKQRLFVQYYLESSNATEAAKKAYDTTDDNVASSIGYENLRKPEISQLIKNGIVNAGVTIDAVLLEMVKCAFSDVIDYIDFDDETGKVTIKNFNKISGGKTRAIRKIKAKRIVRNGETEYSQELELHSKDKSLEMLAKYLKMFDQKDQGDKGTLMQLLEVLKLGGVKKKPIE